MMLVFIFFAAAALVPPNPTKLGAAQIEPPVVIEEVKEDVIVEEEKTVEAGKETQKEIILPEKSLAVIGVSATSTTQTPGLVIALANRISTDGGTTWTEFGSFVCGPQPWFDRTHCGVVFGWTDAKGKPIPLPSGTKTEMESTVSARGELGLSYQFSKSP